MKLNYKDFTHLKKCIIILLSLLLIVNNMGFGGWGIVKEVSAASIESWINITDKAGLLSIQNNLSGNYRLMANIDLAGENWTSLGEFTGKLDGNSKVIINIAVTNTNGIHQGLFSGIGASGQVYNLGIEGANITGGDYTGILAGVNHGTIDRTYVKGSISGNEYVGGLVGKNTGIIQNCFSSAHVSGKDFIGGLVGANSGTVEGSYSSSEISASVFNNYLHFDGSTGYIQIPHHASYATDAFTLEAWFQWEGVDTDNVNFIISKGFEQFEIHTGGGAFTNGIRFIPTLNNASDSYLDARNVMQTGWFHVAAVYQYNNGKAIARVYINGIAQDLWQNGSNMGTEVRLARETNPLVGNSLPIDIGRRSDNTYYFQGKIADVRFWNTARTTEQIQTNKDRILVGNEAGLVGYWKLNEANGTVAIDTINSNNGTLYGGVTRTTEVAAIQTGGLIGVNTGSVTSSYYDTQVSLQTDTGKGDPKTTAQMKNQATYTGWNFIDVWGLDVSVNNGYPNILPAYTVSFGITGGNGNLAAKVDDIGINSGDMILEGKSVVLTATPNVGYRVKAWTVGGAIVAGETGNIYTLTNVLDAATITVELELIPTYTVTYSGNGSTGGNVPTDNGNYVQGATVTILGNTGDLLKAGYTFNGWNTLPDGNGTSHTPGTSFAISAANVTMYAQWAANANTAYMVEHYQQNVIGEDYTLFETENLTGTTDTLATAISKNYTGFTENTTINSRVANGSILADGSLILKLYYDRNTYTISFDSAGGSHVGAITQKYGTEIEAPAAPSREGYTFAGWIVDIPATMPAENMILIAQWTAIPTATPTDEPTNTPTSTPTSTPTATNETTNTPTPTDEPTNTPTNTPTSTSTPIPTSIAIPAKAPTAIATTAPTAIPTATPAVTPTAVPLSDIHISGDKLADANKDTDLTKDIKVGIFIDGKKKDDTANASVQVVDKKVIVTVMVDKETAMDKLKEAEKVVTIPVSGQLDKFVGQLYGDMIREVEKNATVIEIKTDAVTYSLPAAETRIESVAKQFGDNVEVKDVIVNISIEKPFEEVVKVIESIANTKGFAIIASPLEFKVEATYGEKSIEIDRFESYVKRAVAIPVGVDPSRITTGVVVDSDGIVRHVPTRVEVIDGKYYAVINSLTNSTYSVIWNPLEYKDVENHWAKVAVNDMASRMVIGGLDNGSFGPDKCITRAEFAAIIVKALGLKPGMGKNPFTDVDSSDMYKKYIDTAFEYNIIYGHKNGKFGSMEILTREQAMTMIARAMRITGLRMSSEDMNSSSISSLYKEVDKITSWAKESVAVCVDTGIVTGRLGKTLAPKDNITRAEVATIVRRLLQKSNLY